jgi:uncharacterized membrane protein
MSKLMRLLRHLWLDARDAERALGKDGLDRIERRITESERLHYGQICVCVEASLPLRYLWRHLGRGEPIEAVIADRALTMFGKQRVWDTEHNNGVLIYVLLAEHEIDILADRGLSKHVSTDDWLTTIGQALAHLRDGRLEDGLNAAIREAHAVLAQHFPRESADESTQSGKDLPNRPQIR